MNTILNDIFIKIFETSITASLLIVTVLLMRAIISKKSCRWIVCLLWALVGIRLLVPFSIESDFSLIPEFSVKYTDTYTSKENISEEIASNENDENISTEISKGNEFEDTSKGEFENVSGDYSKGEVENVSGDYSENEFENTSHNNSESKADNNSETSVENNIGVNSRNDDVSENIILNPEDTSANGNDYEKPLTSAENIENANNDKNTTDKSNLGIINLSKKSVNFFSFSWLIGTILFSAYGFIQYIKLKRKVSVFSLCGNGIRKCEIIDSPFVLGVISPKIYMPSGLSEKTEKYIIFHESSHIKRLDHISKILAFIALSIYWFNPLVWVSFILLCKDIEYACDEKVLSKLSDSEKKEYASALLECSIKGSFITACPVSFGEIGVKERVKHTLSYKKPLLWIIIVCIILCAVLSVFFLTEPKTEEDRSNESSELSAEQSEEVSEIVSENEISEESSKETIYLSGYCGATLNYEINGSLLVISGTGEMFDYSKNDAPWKKFEEIEHIVINEGVTSIGQKAFSAMKIKSVSLPLTLTLIDSYAFERCHIQEITIPDSVVSIGGGVFEGCTLLENASLGSSLKRTGGAAFKNCTSLKEVNLKNVEVISREAFSGCKSLKKIELEKVKDIYDSAFSGCISLSSINFPDSIYSVGENVLSDTALYADPTKWENGSLYIDNVLIDVDKNSIEKTFEVKKGTKVIGGAVFKKNHTIENVILPDSLVSIGNDAFAECIYLKEIKMPPSVNHLGQSAFYSCYRLKKAEIGAVTDCYDTVFLACDNLETVSFANGASFVGFSMFDGCEKLKTVSLCDSIEIIESAAFLGCSSLENISFPKNLKSIGDEAFKNCKKLASVSLGDSLEEIGIYAFFNCSSLEKINLGKNVKSFGKFAFVDTAFYNDKSNIKENFLSIGDYLISPEEDSDGKGEIKSVLSTDDNSKNESCSEDENSSVDDEAPDENEGVCGNDSGLKWSIESETLVIEGIGKMPDYKKGYAPWNKYAESIKAIEVKEGVTSIGTYAFYGVSVEQASISSTVSSIKEGAFMNCTFLESVSFSESLTTIGSSSFMNCTSLKEALIPESVTYIGESAFKECTSLKVVKLSPQIVTIKRSTFGNCISMEKIYIGKALKLIEAYAFARKTSLTPLNFNYSGTLEAWENIEKEDGWKYVGNYSITSNGLGNREKVLSPVLSSSSVPTLQFRGPQIKMPTVNPTVSGINTQSNSTNQSPIKWFYH